MDVVVDGKHTVVESTGAMSPVTVTTPKISIPEVPAGPTKERPLGFVFGARSGDKGPNANLGIFARSPQAYAWLDAFLSVEVLQELMPEARDRRIDRYQLPNILSLNFIFHGLLEEGVAASTRQDPQAKALGEYLRAKVVSIPESLL
tara:strand:- start:81 stop:521 length:441 start_codon:yes stop_codon:yes gene_type:complete